MHLWLASCGRGDKKWMPNAHAHRLRDRRRCRSSFTQWHNMASRNAAAPTAQRECVFSRLHPRSARDVHCSLAVWIPAGPLISPISVKQIPLDYSERVATLRRGWRRLGRRSLKHGLDWLGNPEWWVGFPIADVRSPTGELLAANERGRQLRRPSARGALGKSR